MGKTIMLLALLLVSKHRNHTHKQQQQQQGQTGRKRARPGQQRQDEDDEEEEAGTLVVGETDSQPCESLLPPSLPPSLEPGLFPGVGGMHQVVPLSLVSQWRSELTEHCLPASGGGLSVAVYYGTDRKQHSSAHSLR